MPGVLLTLLFVLGAVGWGRWVVRRWDPDAPSTLQLGLGGILGLGGVGWLTFWLGLLPGGLRWGLVVVALVGLGGWVRFVLDLRRVPLPMRRPVGHEWLFLAPLLLLGLFGLVGVLAPSGPQDWDSLAYHLAVPKLWLEAGHAYSVSFIHHSNFPFVFDNLYVWGLAWGGEHGAKAFAWAFFPLGCLVLYGWAQDQYGGRSAWWAALAFASIPVVAWEAGTAYIDVSHGLCAGLGLLYGARFVAQGRDADAWWAAATLGLAAGSKYTGLQTMAVVGILLVAGWALGRRLRWGTIGISAALAVVLAGPWYVRNAIVVGNPVFPFFYERLGGKHWDAFAAEIYRDEQQTFGVGRRPEGGRDPLAFAHAVFGMAYQPGRYTNPNPMAGLGTPTQALGAAIFVAAFLWMVSGRVRRFEGYVLGGLFVSFLLWFFLSQQSRYAVNFGVPLAILAGGAVGLPVGVWQRIALVAQALYTVFLMKVAVVDPQLPAALRRESREEHLARTFYPAAQRLNQLAVGGRVALFDEVFGYWLDVPYFWANPGHSTEIYGDGALTSREFGERLRAMGFTHVYLNLQFQDRDFRERWLSAMDPRGRPFDTDERAGLEGDLRTHWKVWFADVAAAGTLQPVEQIGNGIIFVVR